MASSSLHLTQNSPFGGLPLGQGAAIYPATKGTRPNSDSTRNDETANGRTQMQLSLYSIFDVVHSLIFIAGAWGWAVWAARQPDSHSELIKHLTWSRNADC